MPSASFIEILLAILARLLFPTGRAFKIPAGGVFDRLNKALAKSEARAYADAYSILDSAIADNPNFTEADATDWERRLGIASGGSAVPLADRMLAINRKINHPGTKIYRQPAAYIEDQLRVVGFDVHVFENRFPDGSGGWETRTPDEILGTTGAAVHSSSIFHGTIVHGQSFKNMCVNTIEEGPDTEFVIGSNYRSTFYISGVDTMTWADVPAARKDEFRQLILHLKPAQMVAFLFVNYV